MFLEKDVQVFRGTGIGFLTDNDGRVYFRPKSAGISPHSLVSHLRIGVV